MENISEHIRLSDFLYVYVKNSFKVCFVRQLKTDNIQQEINMTFEAFENLVSPTISEIIRKGLTSGRDWGYFDERNVPIKIFQNNFFEGFVLNKNCWYKIQKLVIGVVTNTEWVEDIIFLKEEWEELICEKKKILSKITLARSNRIQEGIQHIIL